MFLHPDSHGLKGIRVPYTTIIPRSIDGAYSERVPVGISARFMYVQIHSLYVYRFSVHSNVVGRKTSGFGAHAGRCNHGSVNF